MKVLVLGATGFIGRHIVRQLLKKTHQVVAIVRHCPPNEILDPESLLQWRECDHWADINWREYLSGVDAVINCMGIFQAKSDSVFDQVHFQFPLSLFRACETLNIRRVVQMSALGVGEHPDIAFLASKEKLDIALQTLDLDYLILRPSSVYGVGERSMAFFRSLSIFPVLFLPAKGKAEIQPVWVEELAESVVNFVEVEHCVSGVVAAVGSQSISLGGLINLHRQWMGKKTAKLISLPSWGGSLVGWFGESLGSMFISRKSFTMSAKDNSANAESFNQLLGRPSLSIAQYLGQTPASARDYWQAWQNWLTPALRLSLAMMWIFTGIVSLFFYPWVDSYKLLAQSGVPAGSEAFFLVAASIMDFALGIALVLRYQMTLILSFQLLVMLFYTFVISWSLMEFWLHPFGPILKNIPIIAATGLLLVLEKQK